MDRRKSTLTTPTRTISQPTYCLVYSERNQFTSREIEVFQMFRVFIKIQQVRLNAINHTRPLDRRPFDSGEVPVPVEFHYKAG
jgi:hypothetical protein